MNRNNWADWQNHLRKVEEDKNKLQRRIAELEVENKRLKEMVDRWVPKGGYGGGA